ncbi:MAG: ribbon-helix-helix protein, CopG family [Gemmatimonadota bacterium]
MKLDRETDDKLKRLAAARGKSKGQLVREAISASLQPSLDDLPLTQRQALSAYQGGYISIGRLSQAMGMHVLALRTWLNERGIEQQIAFRDDDAGRA